MTSFFNPPNFLGRSLIGAVGLGVALLGLPQSANALSIFKGTDYVMTPSGGAEINLPGFGVVQFTGLPINTGVSGAADTIINRTQDVPQSGGTTPLEIVGLSLRKLNVGNFDLFAGLQSYSGGTASTGTMTIRHENLDTDPTQGTWDSSFTINGTVVVVPKGTLNSNGQVDFVKTLVAGCGTLGYYQCVDFTKGPFSAFNEPWTHEPLIGQITGPNLVGTDPTNFYLTAAVDHVSPDGGIHGITPVPWETDALPVVGSTVLFGLGVWAKSKFAKSTKNVNLD
jgi:hypothetical protein